jgi:TM2 domain-containing membrane protein YozV
MQQPHPQHMQQPMQQGYGQPQPGYGQPQQGYGQPQPVNVVVQNNMVPVPMGPTGMVRLHNRNKMVAAMLALFVGTFGIHKFYLGQVGAGIVYLLFFWTGIPSLIALIEGLIYLTKSDQAFDMEYNYR